LFHPLWDIQGQFFSVYYNEKVDQIISTGRDSSIIVWSKDGKQRERLLIPRHYACSMDVNPRYQSLYICGVSKESGSNSPALIRYANKGNWFHSGTLEKKSNRLISCVKVLSSDQTHDSFVTGETDLNKDNVGFVRLYDAESQPFEKLEPIITYEEHKDIVAALAPCSVSDGFFSGSRDHTIKLWDRRQPKSVATLGTLNQSRIAAHDGMVTCLDNTGYTLVSGGLDKKVVVWDIRSVGGNNGVIPPLVTFKVDDTALLKVAIGPDKNSAAVSSLRGLYMLDLSSGTHTMGITRSGTNGQNRYHDLKWDIARNILYAAGDDYRVDGYELK